MPKTNWYSKWIVSLLLIIYLVLNCLSWTTDGSQFSYAYIFALLVIAVLQIILLWRDHAWLQMIGVLGLPSALFFPTVVEIKNMIRTLGFPRDLENLPQSISITKVGWCAVVLAWILLAADIYLAIIIQIHNTALKKQTQTTTEERDEVIL